MRNLIEVSNHILSHSECYLGEEEVTDSMREEALELCLKHGDAFVLDFTRVYLDVQREEILKEDY
tara:strand:- start:1019 stop:1213 length:195 start_codon:yes stop_codon:yes gene_type:complete